MRLVAIVGASGFIGSHATNAFRSSGESVLALSRRGKSMGCQAVDYMDVNALAVALKGVSSVVHVAGLAHVSPSLLADAEIAYYSANAHVAANVANAAIAAGVERFVLLSSAGVFGPQSPPGGFSDSMEPQPYDPYTKSKLEGERRVLEIASGRMGLIILRPPMVYGPNAPGSFQRLYKWVEKGLPLPVGRISARRSFIGIRNLCSALVAAESSSQIGILPMIVADREPVSVGEFAREMALVHGRRSPIIPVPRKMLEYGLRLVGMQDEYRRIALPFELLPSRIHSILNWRAPHSLAEELRWAKCA
jgi:nucleoside-diphosphate-sugar epimerase